MKNIEAHTTDVRGLFEWYGRLQLSRVIIRCSTLRLDNVFLDDRDRSPQTEVEGHVKGLHLGHDKPNFFIFFKYFHLDDEVF